MSATSLSDPDRIGPVQVLHVDDDPEFADLTATFLEREDDRFTVATATSASEGRERLSREPFDCIVSDYEMPGQNGIEFLRAVRESYPEIPFVLFTGKGSEEVASDAISAGVSDYLQKGMGTDRYSLLANRIRNLVSQYRAESRLLHRAEQQERVAELGKEALAGAPLETLFEQTVDILVDTLDTEFSKVLEYRREHEDLLLRAGVGWRDGLVGEATVGTDEDSQAGHTIRSEEPIVVEDLRTEDRFRGPPLLVDHDVVSGISVIIGSSDDPWGVLGTHTTTATEFTHDDIMFVQNVANVLATAIERTEQEQELRQKERRYQAVFNDPNILVGLTATDGTVLDINRTAMAYIDASLDEVTGTKFWETPWFDHSEALQAQVREWIDRAASGEYVDFEADLVHPNGEPYTVGGVFRPVTNDDGEVVSLLISDRDITERKERERELQQLTEKYETIFNHSKDAIFLLEVEDGQTFRIAEINEREEELLGRPTSEVRGKTLYDLYDAETADRAVDAYQRCLDAGEPITDVATYELDGEQRLFETNFQPVWADGEIVQIVGVSREITEQRQRQQELEETNALLSMLIETLPVGMIAEDESREVIAVNDRLVELFELTGSPEDVVGADCERLAEAVSSMSADPARFVERIHELVDNTEPVQDEEIALQDGRLFARSYAPVELPDGRGHLWMYRDITDRKDREERLRETTARLEALFENSPDMIDVLNPEGVLIDVNHRFCVELGYAEDELLGRPIWEIDRLVDEDDVRGLLSEFDRDERRKFEGSYERQDGTTVPVEVHLLRLDVNGEDRFLAISRDISERKEFEEEIIALHEATQEIFTADTEDQVIEIVVEALRDILDMPINGIAVHDETENVLRTVARTDRSYDLLEGDLVFKPGENLAWEAFDTGDTKHYADVSTVSGRSNPDTSIRSEIIVPMGEHGVVLIGSPEVGVFGDVDVSLAETLATHAETALDRIARDRVLERSEARHRSLTNDVLDTSAVGTFILNSEFEVVWITEATEAYFGLSREAVIGADKRRLIDDRIKHAVEDSASFAETVLATYDDNTYVEEFECHVLPGDDRDERWLKHWSQPIETGLYAGGRIEHYTDITERMRRELELEQQNDRLEEFAGVVSHDLRNPLNVAQGRLELARAECASEHLDSVGDALERSQALIEDLLTLARHGNRVSDLESVDLATVTEHCWRNVATGGASITVASDRTIRADRSRLQQLLENLYRNAIDHGGDDVAVTVGDLPDGFYVEDDGPGIPVDKRERVFDIGYSTAAEGTGFGLSIVSQVADAHGWTVRPTAGSMGGARFEITGVEFDA